MNCDDGLCGWQRVGRCSPRRGWPIEYGGGREPADRLQARARLLANHGDVFAEHHESPPYWERESWWNRTSQDKPPPRRRWVKETWKLPPWDVRNRRVIYRRCLLPEGHQGGHQW